MPAPSARSSSSKTTGGRPSGRLRARPSSSSDRDRPVATTAKPRAFRRSVIASPKPRVAPVTMTTWDSLISLTGAHRLARSSHLDIVGEGHGGGDHVAGEAIATVLLDGGLQVDVGRASVAHDPHLHQRTRERAAAGDHRRAHHPGDLEDDPFHLLRMDLVAPDVD